jgi:hypothetical protein
MIVPEIPALYRLKKTDIVTGSDLLTRAFLNDPLFTASLSGERQLEKIIHVIFKTVLYTTIDHGVAYASSKDLEGIILWQPSNKSGISFRAMTSGGGFDLLRAKPESLKRLLRGERLIRKEHRRLLPEAHWYLAAVAVNPELQGKGIASGMLGHCLNAIDFLHFPCFLETENERNIPLYERFGFQIRKTLKLPETGIPCFLMIREAGASHRAS